LATLVELEFALSQFRAQCQSTAKAVKWEFLSQEGRKRAVNVEAEGISHLITLSLSHFAYLISSSSWQWQL
jgi:hypothetical protein